MQGNSKKAKGKTRFAIVMPFGFCLLTFAFSLFGQSPPVSHKKTARPHTTAHPKAIIETSAGALICSLFPEKAPIGVANFIGLATGTKDWTDPRTRQLVHGKPLYDGTICH